MGPTRRRRLPCFPCLYLKIVLLFFTLCLLASVLFLSPQVVPRKPDDLYPLIQFDRSGFTKAEIVDSSQHALQALSKLTVQEDVEDDSEDVAFDFMKYVLDVEDRKTRRQLLALEALGLSSESDFKEMSRLGYNKPTNVGNETQVLSKEYYKSLTEKVEHRSPDYKRLCFDSTFTVDNLYRTVDKAFCSRLNTLATAIAEGREPPLLTIFAWWMDPVNDDEILSRKAMISNWNIFRPFIVPVVFTNHRMNMAYANGNGWPCFPVTETNRDGLPVFENLSRTLTQKFVSSFYGHAKQMVMFDSSLLETLLTIKHSYVPPMNILKNLHKSAKTRQHTVPDAPLIIHGRSINMPHPGPDPFINFEHLYKYLRETPLNGGDPSMEKSNYVFYTGLDFTNLPPLVVHDDYLFQCVVDFSARKGYTVIDASKTILAIKTFRFDNRNEWGKHYFRTISPDPLFNRRLAAPWCNKEKHGKEWETRNSEVFTRFDPKNNSCVLSI